MNKEKILYTIISGRTKLDLGGLILFTKEPGPALINRSYEIYEEVYDRAYMDGLYIEEELKGLLIEQDIWMPYEDKLIEDEKKRIDDKKVEAFENYFKSRELAGIKRALKAHHNILFSLLNRKATFSNLTCGHAAETARRNWLLLRTTYHKKKLIKDYDFDIDSISRSYFNRALDNSQIRAIAHYDIWRCIWNTNKAHGGKLFNRNPTNFTRDQLTLCSYTAMYDNVYEHPESPNEKVIEDDDCLDGWFIFQKRKTEKDKNSRQVEDLIKNPKIKDSKEIFVMARAQPDIESIQGLNDGQTRNVVKQRDAVIEQKGKVSDLDFIDVQNELIFKSHQMSIDKMKKQ